jgi:hydroxymethylpyrimidine/phosphomethylpyrimidine kinase
MARGGEEALRRRLLPLATVITPNLLEAEALVGAGLRDELVRRLYDLGPGAVIVTGGHGSEPVDTLYDGARITHIPVARHAVAATHGAGCTHSATLAALLARGLRLEEAAKQAAEVAAEAVRRGLTGLGAGEGPVDVLGLAAR